MELLTGLGLTIVAVLLVVDVVTDKIPALDSTPGVVEPLFI
jgi:hypothetical protein